MKKTIDLTEIMYYLFDINRSEWKQTLLDVYNIMLTDFFCRVLYDTHQGNVKYYYAVDIQVVEDEDLKTISRQRNASYNIMRHIILKKRL